MIKRSFCWNLFEFSGGSRISQTPKVGAPTYHLAKIWPRGSRPWRPLRSANGIYWSFMIGCTLGRHYSVTNSFSRTLLIGSQVWFGDDFDYCYTLVKLLATLGSAFILGRSHFLCLIDDHLDTMGMALVANKNGKMMRTNRLKMGVTTASVRPCSVPTSTVGHEIFKTNGRWVSYPKKIVKNPFFLKKYLEDVSPFRGATDTPVLDFWSRLLWVSKPGWIPRLHALSPACNEFLRFTSGATPADWKEVS